MNTVSIHDADTSAVPAVSVAPRKPSSVERFLDASLRLHGIAQHHQRSTSRPLESPMQSAARALFIAVSAFYARHTELSMQNDVLQALQGLLCIVQGRQAGDGALKKAVHLFEMREAAHDPGVYAAICGAWSVLSFPMV